MEENEKRPLPLILEFERNAKIHSEFITRRKSKLSGNGLKLTYKLTINIKHYKKHKLKIVWSTASTVKVFSDLPKKKKHTYPDGSLCMWYPKDPEEKKWVFDDGLFQLINLSIIHLYKENYWNETGEWLGDEAPHGEQPEKDQSPNSQLD